ncbi:MAG TPA: LCP family protein [Jatrophihabitantaceae bacterium]|nr:LCP family protein [Jatrophihabitantaceae bacterium]
MVIGPSSADGSANPQRPAVPPRARFWLRISIAALSFATLIGSGLAWATFKNFTSDVPHGAPVPALAAGQQDPDGADQNVLLVGNDSRAGATKAELKALHDGGGGGVNTDTMIVLHIPADGSAPTLVSIPRDSWVRIPGYGKNKINAAYGDAYTTAKDHHRSELQAQSAGLIETIKTIETLTGLHIDHYAQVNLFGFYRISTAIGGVTVCLKAAQNASTDSDAYGHGYSGIDLPKGVSVIEGKQALAFVRQRHGLPNGDLDRIKRQQYFLASALHKITSAGVLLNPFKLHDLLTAVGSSLLTDPSLNLLDLAREMQSVAQGKIKYLTIPNEGPQMIYPDGVATSIVGVDTVAMPGFIRRLQGKPDDPALAAANPAAPVSVPVDVLNGTDVVGLAGRNAGQLRKDGFHVETVDSTDTAQATTQIEYPAGKQSAAKAVLALVPGAQTVLTATVKRVTLVLGSDGRQVAGLGGASTASAHPKAKPAAKTAGLGCIN